MSDRLRYIWFRCGQFNENGSAETGSTTMEQFGCWRFDIPYSESAFEFPLRFISARIDIGARRIDSVELVMLAR